MPVLGRIDWVLRQAQMGRKMHVVVGQALDSSKTKIKVVLDPPSSGTLGPFTAEAIIATLRLIRNWAIDGSAMDRGHKHSNGQSFVHIWLSITPSGTQSRAAPAIVHATVAVPSQLSLVDTLPGPETVPLQVTPVPGALDTVPMSLAIALDRVRVSLDAAASPFPGPATSASPSSQNFDPDASGDIGDATPVYWHELTSEQKLFLENLDSEASSQFEPDLPVEPDP